MESEKGFFKKIIKHKKRYDTIKTKGSDRVFYLLEGGMHGIE